MITQTVVLKKKKEKTRSQQLRDVMFLYWKQLSQSNDGFETFYEKHMDGLIAQYQARLKDTQ